MLVFAQCNAAQAGAVKEVSGDLVAVAAWMMKLPPSFHSMRLPVKVIDAFSCRSGKSRALVA